LVERVKGIEPSLSAWEIASSELRLRVDLALYLIRLLGIMPARYLECRLITLAPGTCGARRGHATMWSSVRPVPTPRVRPGTGALYMSPGRTRTASIGTISTGRMRRLRTV